jgi:hypothetical protein
LEWLAHYGVNDVRKVTTAEFVDLLGRWQHGFNGGGVHGELENLLDGETFELRHIDDLDSVALDDRLNPHGEVSQVPNGDGLVAGQIRSDFAAEEAVDL